MWRSSDESEKDMDTQVREGTGSEVLLNISGNDIRRGTGSSVLLNIDGYNVRKGTGSKVVLNVNGNQIRAGTGSSIICNIRSNEIRRGDGLSVLLNINGNSIRRGTGNSTLYNTTRRLNTVELAAVLCALGDLNTSWPVHVPRIQINGLDAVAHEGSHRLQQAGRWGSNWPI